MGVFTSPISKLRSSAEFDHPDSRGIPLAPGLADKTHEQMRLPVGIGLESALLAVSCGLRHFITR